MAKFYSARSKTIPPLPWQTFALPFSENAVTEILRCTSQRITVQELMERLNMPFSPNGSQTQMIKQTLIKFGWDRKKSNGIWFYYRTSKSIPPIDPRMEDYERTGRSNIVSMRSNVRKRA